MRAQAIDRVHRYVADMTGMAFLDDEKPQDAAVRKTIRTGLPVVARAGFKTDYFMTSSNFAFLQSEWSFLYGAASKAEGMTNTDAPTSCFYARRTLELAVD